MIRWAPCFAVLPLVACAAPHDAPSTDAATTDTAADPTPDALGVDALPAPDPWTAPLGAPIAGATLSDGWTDLRALLPPLVIQGGWTDSLFALPDGIHLRFAYEPTDFFQFFHSNGTVQTITGPQLLGETGPFFKNFDATLTASGWTIATDVLNSPDPTITEASPAANASDDVRIFSRFDAGTGRSHLWASIFTNGAWPAASVLPIDSASCNDDNAKIVGEPATGIAAYFESNRGNLAGTGTTCGQRTLYTTTYANNAFTPVTQVPGITTADSDDSQPFITTDQSTLYWTSIRANAYGIFTATRGSNGSFSAIHQIVSPTLVPPVSGKMVLVGEASVVVRPQGELLYLMCGVASNDHNGMTYDDADNIRLIPCVARRPHG